MYDGFYIWWASTKNPLNDCFIPCRIERSFKGFFMFDEPKYETWQHISEPIKRILDKIVGQKNG